MSIILNLILMHIQTKKYSICLKHVFFYDGKEKKTQTFVQLSNSNVQQKTRKRKFIQIMFRNFFLRFFLIVVVIFTRVCENKTKKKKYVRAHTQGSYSCSTHRNNRNAFFIVSTK